VREIARSFLTGAGITLPGELARVTGLSRPEAGLGNRALVAEGFAVSPARGVYRIADFGLRTSELECGIGMRNPKRAARRPTTEETADQDT